MPNSYGNVAITGQGNGIPKETNNILIINNLFNQEFAGIFLSTTTSQKIMPRIIALRAKKNYNLLSAPG